MSIAAPPVCQVLLPFRHSISEELQPAAHGHLHELKGDNNNPVGMKKCLSHYFSFIIVS
jgi:hypothetical protein